MTIRYALSTLLILSAVSSVAATPEDILKRADAIRNPSETYKMTVEVTSPENKQVLDVFLKGRDKTIIVTKEPARDIGRNMLMLDRDFYAFIPNLKRSVRLSLAQKLNGQVANGDIARTRWHGDYTPTVTKQTDKFIELFLDGNKDNLTYQKMRLWVQKNTFRPLKAEYLSLDGKTLLKRAYFEKYKPLAGADRPSQIRIEDVTGQKSIISIKRIEVTKLNDAQFSQRNLETLR